MIKDKWLNLPLLIISLIGCAVAFIINELMLVFFNPIPYILQTGIYMTLNALICGFVIFFAEFTASGGYIKRFREVFYKDSAKAFFIFVPIALVVGITTQFLYGLAGIELFEEPVTFEGTLLVCDTSGSMNNYDPDRAAVDAMLSYIDEIPLYEYFGLITYESNVWMVREYQPLESETERERLKELVLEIEYYGGTNTQEALLTAIDEIRAVDGKHPGLVILFSDGTADYMRYREVQAAARGSAIDPREVPVNTVFFSSNPMGGYQMSQIAKLTGGVYMYQNVRDTAYDIFAASREMYETEKLHLLRPVFGDKRDSPLRFILQALFIAVWVVTISLLAVFLLNNKNLFRHFLIPRIIIAVAAGVAFTAFMRIIGYESEIFVRLIPIVSMMVLTLPTYTLGNDPGMRSGY